MTAQHRIETLQKPWFYTAPVQLETVQQSIKQSCGFWWLSHISAAYRTLWVLRDHSNPIFPRITNCVPALAQLPFSKFQNLSYSKVVWKCLTKHSHHNTVFIRFKEHILNLQFFYCSSSFGNYCTRVFDYTQLETISCQSTRTVLYIVLMTHQQRCILCFSQQLFTPTPIHWLCQGKVLAS